MQVQPPAESQQPQTISEYYESIMAIPGAPWIIWISVLIVLILFAAYIAGLFRNLAIGDSDPEDQDHLSEFRKLRDQGLIDDQEYKRLTSVVPLPLTDNSPSQTKSLPSSVNPAPLAGGGVGGGANAEPAKRPLTLAEAEALKKKRDQEEAGAQNQVSDAISNPDESDDETDPMNP